MTKQLSLSSVPSGRLRHSEGTEEIKERVTLAHFLKVGRANVIVLERPCPPALSEAALGIFFCAIRSLYDTVQRHKL